MKTIIIDGYNLLFKMQPDLMRSNTKWLMETGRERLIDRLKSFSGERKIELVVVFDGAVYSNRQPYPHLRVIFTGIEEEADAFIIEWVKRQPRPKNILVVSSDTDIRNRLLRTGVRVISSEEFQQILSPSLPEPSDSEAEPPEKFSGIPPEQVSGWLKIFGLEDDD